MIPKIANFFMALRAKRGNLRQNQRLKVKTKMAGKM
jgi:hypothetical protein